MCHINGLTYQQLITNEMDKNTCKIKAIIKSQQRNTLTECRMSFVNKAKREEIKISLENGTTDTLLRRQKQVTNS